MKYLLVGVLTILILILAMIFTRQEVSNSNEMNSAEVNEVPLDTINPFMSFVHAVVSDSNGTNAHVVVTRGFIRKGEAVEVFGLDNLGKTFVVNERTFSSDGDYAVLTFNDLEGFELNKGTVIAKPNSINTHKEFRGIAYIFNKDVYGARHTAFFNSFKAIFHFWNIDVQGTMHLNEGGEMVMPGDLISFRVTLEESIAIENRTSFLIKEGNKIIGNGFVTDLK